jgi:hypothetical protein
VVEVHVGERSGLQRIAGTVDQVVERSDFFEPISHSGFATQIDCLSVGLVAESGDSLS